jgi:NAD/NADP transhydrogenase beta subunit
VIVPGYGIVIKRSQPGFAGIDNDLFYHEKSSKLFSDAKQAAADPPIT